MRACADRKRLRSARNSVTPGGPARHAQSVHEFPNRVPSGNTRQNEQGLSAGLETRRSRRASEARSTSGTAGDDKMDAAHRHESGGSGSDDVLFAGCAQGIQGRQTRDRARLRGHGG